MWQCVSLQGQSWWNKKLVYSMSQEIASSVVLKVWTEIQNLLEMQPLGPYPRPTESETLAVRPSNQCFNKPSKSHRGVLLNSRTTDQDKSCPSPTISVPWTSKHLSFPPLTALLCVCHEGVRGGGDIKAK